jgi:protein-L-isoaspartate(D-aspartate) O-methyltransferase
VNDNFRHKGLRTQLINQLREKGITDENVLRVMNKIPRHLFFDKVFHDKFAYDDVAFPIGAGQTISQPYTVAFQSSLLQIAKRDKILEIGTGCGYQTAVLCELEARVFTIERQLLLFKQTNNLLDQMGYRAKTYFGDGFEGKKVFAPYDGIIVTCGAPFVPEKLKYQLKVNGRMVIPVGEGDTQQMKLIVRLGEDDFSATDYGDFSFVPMLKDKSK